MHTMISAVGPSCLLSISSHYHKISKFIPEELTPNHQDLCLFHCSGRILLLLLETLFCVFIIIYILDLHPVQKEEEEIYLQLFSTRTDKEVSVFTFPQSLLKTY